MDPFTSAGAAQAAREEELRGECAKAFALYKKGNLTQANTLVKNLLARHPAHPLLHFAHVRLVHMLAMENQADVVHEFVKLTTECGSRGHAWLEACPESLLPRLLFAQLCYDFRTPDSEIDLILTGLRDVAATVAAMPIYNADFECAKVGRCG
jgi:hypothetical protein